MKPPEPHTIHAFTGAIGIFKKVLKCDVHRCSYISTSGNFGCENHKCIINARSKEQYITVTHILEEGA